MTNVIQEDHKQQTASVRAHIEHVPPLNHFSLIRFPNTLLTLHLFHV